MAAARSKNEAPDYRKPAHAEPVDPVGPFDAADTEDTDAAPEVRSATVSPAQHGQRLDKVLVALAPEFSRSHVQQLIESGHAQVQGSAVTLAARRVRAGEAISLALVPTDESRAFRPEPEVLSAVSIVHEDDHVIVLVKPAGLVVHPGAGNWSGTLLNGLLAHHAGAAALPRAGIVHRLDKDTSGLMVVGKTLPAVTALVRAIAARVVQRSYLALAWGEVPAALCIDAPIGRDPRLRTRMAVVSAASSVSGAREARTDVERVAFAEGVSALRCTLHTGRTHQIRVHLASRGWPLVADALYGGRAGLGLARQALHAVRLGFDHPIGGQAMVFEAPPPRDFADAWQRIVGATMRPD
jgi:23S rRNA pseudouridine1911/1915/1917 synthase